MKKGSAKVILRHLKTCEDCNRQLFLHEVDLVEDGEELEND